MKHEAEKRPRARRLGSYADIEAIYGYRRVTTWRLWRAGRFPRPILLPGSGDAPIVRFDLDEVDAWLEGLKAERDTEHATV